MNSPAYNPETYWSRVGREIKKRGENYLAGDDNAYYRYKRAKFLRKFLDTISFDGKSVLEVGFGPGGNLKHILSRYHPTRLLGVDISEQMLDVAKENLALFPQIRLEKIDGTQLPFPDESIDLSFSVTVLQHNTDERVFHSLTREIARVTKDSIILMEDIGLNRTPREGGNWIGRSVDVYEAALHPYNFRLRQCEFLNTKVSRRVYEGATRLWRSLAPSTPQQGEPTPALLSFALNSAIPIAGIFDDLFIETQNLAKMVFQRVA